MGIHFIDINLQGTNLIFLWNFSLGSKQNQFPMEPNQNIVDEAGDFPFEYTSVGIIGGE